MKGIDYSVPDKVKDTTPQFNIGDYVWGDSIYYQKGQISRIEMSTGQRKGLLYFVSDGIFEDCFFYNFLHPWYDGMISKEIGKDEVYHPEHKIKLRYGGIEYTIDGILYHSKLKWCYLLVDKEEGTWQIDESGMRGIGLHSLRENQKKRIFLEVFADLYGYAKDKNGKIIQKGDKVIWIDPETGRKTKYEVYDYPTEDMVKLWSKYGECEALPEECIVLK